MSSPETGHGGGGGRSTDEEDAPAPTSPVPSANTEVVDTVPLSCTQAQTVRVLAHSARGLATRDLNGRADPFLIFYELLPTSCEARSGLVSALEGGAAETTGDDNVIAIAPASMAAAVAIVLGSSGGSDAWSARRVGQTQVRVMVPLCRPASPDSQVFATR